MAAEQRDWAALAEQYSIDYEAEQISPADWCERNHLPYGTAKRYISIKAAKKACELRKSRAKKTRPGRNEKGHFLPGHQIPECVNQNLDNLTPFQPGNQASRTHGGYSKLIRAEDLAIGDESELDGLIAERRLFRARIASALRTIQECEDDLLTGELDEDREIALRRLIRQAETSIERSAARVESLTKTISAIRIDDVTVPHRVADEAKVRAQTEKLKAEVEKLGRKSGADSVLYQLDW